MVEQLVSLSSLRAGAKPEKVECAATRKEVRVVRWSESDGGWCLSVLVDRDFELFNADVTG